MVHTIMTLLTLSLTPQKLQSPNAHSETNSTLQCKANQILNNYQRRNLMWWVGLTVSLTCSQMTQIKISNKRMKKKKMKSNKAVVASSLMRISEMMKLNGLREVNLRTKRPATRNQRDKSKVIPTIILQMSWMQQAVTISSQLMKRTQLSERIAAISDLI